MSRSLRIGIIAAATPVLLAVWATALFAMDRASNGGEVLGRVSVGDVDLNGLTEAAARAELQDLEYRLGQIPVVFDVEGTSFEVPRAQFGFEIDEEALVTAALQNGREGGLGSQFRWWVGHFGNRGEIDLELTATFDASTVEAYTEHWEEEAIDDPPFEGGVRVEGTAVLPEYPRPGTGIDPAGTAELIEAVLLDFDAEPIEVPTDLRVPAVTNADVDGVVYSANQLIEAPVILSRLNPDVQVTFTREVLAEALRIGEVTPNGAGMVEINFDREVLADYLNPIRDQIEFPPVDAQVVIRPDETPTIIPGRNGLLVDEAALPDAVVAATKSVTRVGVFPYVDGAEPETTTEDAEALGIRNLLYRAETYYTPGGDYKNLNRINNIQLIAAAVDGVIVMPGETFSLNEHVGQRTKDKGYKEAGAIIGPIVDCCDHIANIGGGVSQFTTTLYNAVFFAGLEDVEHTPHTLYFPRYPEGREATLGWPDPDLIFRNNLDHAVLIDTDSTDSSVTVRIYGDNGGIEVRSELSERSSYTEPGEYFDPDPDIAPGDQKVTDEGSPGWTVTVYRIITYPDGSETTESWIWRYHAFPKRISVNPCELPDDHDDYEPDLECPAVVPDLIGRNLDYAAGVLNNRGFVLRQGDPWPVGDQADVGRIWRQDPGPGSLLEAGGVVTVRVGVLSG
jgi:vancomycin resistance protein YoaR